MNLYGVLVAQNEGDVIEDLFEFLLEKKYFKGIFLTFSSR